MRLAVLASGSGTLLDSILAAGLGVELVMVDRRCPAQDVAARHGVECRLLERTDFGPTFDRDGFSASVAELLVDAGIDLVIMAGYGTILGQPIHDAFDHRILNTHPALLPSFPGWHAVPDALAAGVKITGCTIHVATLEVDSGPILAQEAVEVRPGDDEASLHERIKAVERRLYVDTIRSVISDPALLKGPTP